MPIAHSLAFDRHVRQSYLGPPDAHSNLPPPTQIQISIRGVSRFNLTAPASPFPPPTCTRFPPALSRFSYSFLLSLQRPPSHSAWRISRTVTLPQSAALTPGVTQQALQKRLGSPTRFARRGVNWMLGGSGGRGSLSHFPHGFFHGWLLSASSPLVRVTI